jgi:hypothetical protein
VGEPIILSDHYKPLRREQQSSEIYFELMNKFCDELLARTVLEYEKRLDRKTVVPVIGNNNSTVPQETQPLSKMLKVGAVPKEFDMCRAVPPNKMRLERQTVPPDIGTYIVSRQAVKKSTKKKR